MDRKSVFSVQNFLKEPTANGTTRLQSFRPPRDLSLGGTKPKKLYAPNLNVTRQRNKQKDVPVKEVKKHVRTQETKPHHHANRNRFVQTQGVISGGLGDPRAKIRRGFTENHASHNSNTISIPKIRKREITESENGTAVVNDLLRDGGVGEDARDGNAPYEMNSETFHSLKASTKIKPEVKADFTQEFFKSEQYSDSNISLSLLQFPDTVAGRIADEDVEDADVKLSDVGEGKIGKIVIRQSGKVQLHIGNKVYNMEALRDAKFTQDVVATVEEDGERKMGKLGSVNLEYMVAPKFRHFLKR